MYNAIALFIQAPFGVKKGYTEVAKTSVKLNRSMMYFNHKLIIK